MTNAELALLTLIAEQPRHGYEIEQVIEQRGMREWTEIGFSSIYYLLKKLEGEGLIAGQLQEAERGPARKIYQITQTGARALHNGLLEALSVPQPCYSGFSLAVGNLPILDSSEVITALSEYRTALAVRLQRVKVRWEEQKPLPYFVDALFDYSVSMIEAEFNWTEEFIKKLEAIHGKD
jgi:DNA-binding PadR family transcriptional regulator